ncbi:MAG: hypothetical protein HY281_06545 [Nitrospirae bacterium]|nr:hypothetical protein [Nitrospirota bacterium]
MKRMLSVFLILAMVVFSAGRAGAAEDHGLENIFKDAYYGAAIGGILGAAVMVFTDRPADHFNYIAYGLAGGVIAGTVYGMANQTRSLADMESGKLTFRLPRPEIQEMPRFDPLDRKRLFIYLPFIGVHF